MKKGCNKKRRLPSIFLTQRFDLTARCARTVCSATIAAHVPAGVLFENLERWHIDNLPVNPLLRTFLREKTRHQRASTPTSLSLQGSTEPLGDEVHKEGCQPLRLPRAQCLWLHHTAGERDRYRCRCCSSAPGDLCPWSCRREKFATNTMPLASRFAGEQDRCRRRRCSSSLADPCPSNCQRNVEVDARTAIDGTGHRQPLSKFGRCRQVQRQSLPPCRCGRRAS